MQINLDFKKQTKKTWYGLATCDTLSTLATVWQSDWDNEADFKTEDILVLNQFCVLALQPFDSLLTFKWWCCMCVWFCVYFGRHSFITLLYKTRCNACKAFDCVVQLHRNCDVLLLTFLWLYSDTQSLSWAKYQHTVMSCPIIAYFDNWMLNAVTLPLLLPSPTIRDSFVETSRRTMFFDLCSLCALSSLSWRRYHRPLLCYHSVHSQS